MSETSSHRAESSTLFTRVSTHDFDEFAASVHGLDTRIRQLSGGLFQGELEVLDFGSLQIMRTVVNRTVQARGIVGSNVMLFSPITPKCDAARWRGRRRLSGEININHPVTEVDHLTAPTYDSLTVIVETTRLLNVGKTLLGVDIDVLQTGISGFRPTQEGFASLETSILFALDLGRLGSARLDSPTGRARMEETLISKLVHSFVKQPYFNECDTESKRQQTAHGAEEFMLAHLRQPLLMTVLCEELGVCERTLRYAFQDRFGCSPLAYFKMLKLNEIRRQYIGRKDDASVQEIARQWGVVHLGNFAADYRRLFAVNPSTTARQNRQLR